MTKRQFTLPMRLGVALTALAMVTTGCSGSDDDDDKTITMGVIPGWTDETATTGLLKEVLEDNGYTVEVTELSDNAFMYTALSNGDIDVLSSGWPELTHKDLMDRFGEKIEDVGVYYEGATSFLAVPEYSDLQSIEDLSGRADEFDGEIIGIEPGAGLTKATQESVMPAYGLDDEYELVLSSTSAMLTELQKATEAEDEIVVTLWKPFWANLAFPVRALEDPEGAFGEPENLHVLARDGFSDDNPEVAEMLENFQMDDEQFSSLENMVVNDFGEGEEQEAARAWLEENPEFGEELAEYLKD